MAVNEYLIKVNIPCHLTIFVGGRYSQKITLKIYVTKNNLSVLFHLSGLVKYKIKISHGAQHQDMRRLWTFLKILANQRMTIFDGRTINEKFRNTK